MDEPEIPGKRDLKIALDGAHAHLTGACQLLDGNATLAASIDVDVINDLRFAAAWVEEILADLK